MPMYCMLLEIASTASSMAAAFLDPSAQVSQQWKEIMGWEGEEKGVPWDDARGVDAVAMAHARSYPFF